MPVIPYTYMSAAGIQSEVAYKTLARVACHESVYRQKVKMYKQHFHNNMKVIRREQRAMIQNAQTYKNKIRKNRTTEALKLADEQAKREEEEAKRTTIVSRKTDKGGEYRDTNDADHLQKVEQLFDRLKKNKTLKAKQRNVDDVQNEINGSGYDSDETEDDFQIVSTGSLADDDSSFIRITVSHHNSEINAVNIGKQDGLTSENNTLKGARRAANTQDDQRMKGQSRLKNQKRGKGKMVSNGVFSNRMHVASDGESSSDHSRSASECVALDSDRGGINNHKPILLQANDRHTREGMFAKRPVRDPEFGSPLVRKRSESDPVSLVQLARISRGSSLTTHLKLVDRIIKQGVRKQVQDRKLGFEKSRGGRGDGEKYRREQPGREDQRDSKDDEPTKDERLGRRKDEHVQALAAHTSIPRLSRAEVEAGGGGRRNAGLRGPRGVVAAMVGGRRAGRQELRQADGPLCAASGSRRPPLACLAPPTSWCDRECTPSNGSTSTPIAPKLPLTPNRKKRMTNNQYNLLLAAHDRSLHLSLSDDEFTLPMLDIGNEGDRGPQRWISNRYGTDSTGLKLPDTNSAHRKISDGALMSNAKVEERKISDPGKYNSSDFEYLTNVRDNHEIKLGVRWKIALSSVRECHQLNYEDD